ncbi:MAG: hypothetical protein ACE5KI_04180 [Dehalococcoidia bacterium]
MLLAGCARAKPTPTPTPTPTLTPAVAAGEALMDPLRAMTLPRQALPGGLVLQAADFTTNQEAASDDPQGTEAALANFQRWGRLLGYRVRYASEEAFGVFRTGGLLAIVTRAVQHRDQAGAQEAFRHWERRLQDPTYLKARLTTRPGTTFNRFQPLPVAPIGDKSLAVDAILSIPAPEGTALFITRFYLFQQGPIMGLLELFYVREPAHLGELEGLAVSFHSRVLAGLGQSQKGVVYSPFTRPALNLKEFSVRHAQVR